MGRMYSIQGEEGNSYCISVVKLPKGGDVGKKYAEDMIIIIKD